MDHDTADGAPQPCVSFLSLPPEIRNTIYKLALIRDQGQIDLWPDAFVGQGTWSVPYTYARTRDNRTEPYSERICHWGCTDEEGRRIREASDCWSCNPEKAQERYPCFDKKLTPEVMKPYVTHYRRVVTWLPQYKRKIRPYDIENYPLHWYVRDQKDLAAIRKDLAAGIIRTCKQIHAEALPIFFGGNSWVFSGNGGWQGLLRFFLTIGPNARRHITDIMVALPLGVEWWFGRAIREDEGQREYKNNLDGRSKNEPKLRMAKVQAEGPQERSSVRQVCEIMLKDGIIDYLLLTVPKNCYVGGKDLDAYYDGLKGLLETHRILQMLTFTQVCLVVDTNAFLGIKNAISRINGLEWHLMCFSSSYIRQPDRDHLAQRFEDAALWTHHKYSFLEGVPTLFGAVDEEFVGDYGTDVSWARTEQMDLDTVMRNLRFQPKPLVFDYFSGED
ncbi:MAG: hypothetical protein L6R39_002046 [Caloplaca ligustica]|nr:MAG: hypothetical protein L6R39_002046 [Caloplaca ligustica]